jgi:hypothetical protein
MSRTLLLLVLAFSLPVLAQDPSTFTPILLPVYTGLSSVPGAYGARFGAGAVAVSRIEQRWYPYELQAVTVLPPNSPRLLLLRGSSTHGGRLVFFEHADAVTFTYQLGSSTPNPSDGGITTVPIVRPDDLFEDSFAILGVPFASTRYRVRLVVYKVDPGAGAVSVDLAVTAAGSLNDVRRRFELSVDRREGDDESYPYFADAALQEACFQPGLPNLPCGPWTGAVVVKPLVPGKYWALVSVTDNMTQRVTLYYPQ